MIARTYVCRNKCKPEVITEPMTYAPKCTRCGQDMVEGDDW